MSAMIQVELSKIIIDEKRQDQIIVMKEKNGDRQFPIVIGFLEASSIKMRLSGVQVPRPMTHDLLLLIIQGLEATMDKLIIDKLVANTFHAKLVLLTVDGQERLIDTRPSDGIALAVRAQAPIFVADDVLKKTALLKLE
jgi:bifunctional DNase/RNase